MEEVTTSGFKLPPLSNEDKSRIQNCDHYKLAKRIIQSTIDYKEYEVGSAVYLRIKSNNKFVGQEYDASSKADKYIIIDNDNGFLFAKKICANGKPGVAVTCLSIEFASDYYTLEVDGDYVEAMLLDSQDQYDPTSSNKDYARKKNKATRENAKKKLVFDTNKEANEHLKTIKVGDTYYRADYAYGGGVTQYIVSDIISRDPIPPKGSGWGRDRNDEEFINAGLDKVIIIKMKPAQTTKTYSYDYEFSYRHISKESWSSLIFKDRPTSPEDIA